MKLEFSREDIIKVLQKEANYLMQVNNDFSFIVSNDYDIPYAGVSLELKKLEEDEPVEEVVMQTYDPLENLENLEKHTEAMMAEEDERTQEIKEEKEHYADSTDRDEAEYDKASSNAGEIL